MAAAPDGLSVARHRDRVSARDVKARRIGVAALSLFLLAGLLNAFGQRPESSRAAVSAASLEIYSPARVRGGLFFESRSHVQAARDLENATLVLSSGWAEGMTINTIEPSPVGEASRNGKLVFELGHIPARRRFLLYIQFKVNPTNVGRRAQTAELYDGDELLTTIHRTITVFP